MTKALAAVGQMALTNKGLCLSFPQFPRNDIAACNPSATAPASALTLPPREPRPSSVFLISPLQLHQKNKLHMPPHDVSFLCVTFSQRTADPTNYTKMRRSTDHALPVDDDDLRDHLVCRVGLSLCSPNRSMEVRSAWHLHVRSPAELPAGVSTMPLAGLRPMLPERRHPAAHDGLPMPLTWWDSGRRKQGKRGVPSHE